jgi:ribosomal protein S18 acetylase RimI-like enzyme
VLDPDDLGHRVVIRHIVGNRTGRTVQSDVLGELTNVTETQFTVRTADGEVAVDRPSVTAAKRVPDRRARSATERLELVAAAGWPAVETGAVGDWLLRASDGWTRRGNSALAVGDPGRPVPAAVDAVVGWYRERGLQPAIAVPLPLGRRVQPHLDRRGWATVAPTLVQTAGLADLASRLSDGPGDRPAGRAGGRLPSPDVRLHREPTPDWFAGVGGRKGGLPPAARRILTGVSTTRYAAGYVAGTLVATARGVLTDGWLGMSVVGVDPAQRRRGWAGRLTAALVDWAVDAGAQRAYLQVEASNEPAVRLYERLGFRIAHTYVVRLAP